MSITFFIVFLSLWFLVPIVGKSFLNKNNIVPEKTLHISLTKGFYFTEWKKKASPFPTRKEVEKMIE